MLDKKPEQIDKWVDYIKQLFVVGFAAGGAYASIFLADSVFLPWALWLMGGSIGYALFLSYKRASLIQGEWGMVLRARVLRILMIGLPLWGFITIAFYLDNSLARLLPEFLADPNSVAFTRSLILLFSLAIVFGRLSFHYGWTRVLEIVGLEDDEKELITKYEDFSAVFQLILVVFIITFSTNFIAAGWLASTNLELSRHYYMTGFAYLIILVCFGAFIAWYIPERCKHRFRLGLELIIGLVILDSYQNVYISTCVVIILLSILYKLTIRYEEIDLRTVIKEKEDESQKDERMKFYDEHPTLRTITLGLFTLILFVGTILVYSEIIEPFYFFLFFILSIIPYGMGKRIFEIWKENREI